MTWASGNKRLMGVVVFLVVGSYLFLRGILTT